MDTKLTLKLDQSVIENAKEYAKSNNTSLSKLIENYLYGITSKPKKRSKITPLVKSLSGIIDLPKGEDYKKNYADFLAEKYSG